MDYLHMVAIGDRLRGVLTRGHCCAVDGHDNKVMGETAGIQYVMDRHPSSPRDVPFVVDPDHALVPLSMNKGAEPVFPGSAPLQVCVQAGYWWPFVCFLISSTTSGKSIPSAATVSRVGIPLSVQPRRL